MRQYTVWPCEADLRGRHLDYTVDGLSELQSRLRGLVSYITGHDEQHVQVQLDGTGLDHMSVGRTWTTDYQLAFTFRCSSGPETPPV